VIPLRQYGRELTRGLSLLPHSPPLVSAPEARLMVSWWNCEIRIWRVKSQADGAGKPKVIARLALKGDENITSVSITADGNLLAVATASGVKLFGLSAANPAAGTALRIRKLITPTTVGAKLVRFSADSKWLAIVSTENHVHLGRIKSEDESEKPYVLPHLLRLHRLSREDTPRDQLNGSENHYSRSITHVEFSPDSDFLAVADLAGYIDTWVTEGHEDITAPEVDIAESVSGSSAEDDDDSDDSDDLEGEDQITASKRRVTIFGQRWIRNPSAHLFPRLDTTPLLLSFRPNPNGSTRPEPNGNPAVHPTRHNPHPHSHDLPETDAQLLIVSAKHQLYLFDVMAGRLSDWSRKNPPSRYPSQYRLLDGPAKGCVWDMAEGNSRLWLYGEKWLFMFDTSKDFPRVTNTQAEQSVQDTDVAEKVSSKKRKRESLREALGKSNSGAGDAAPQNEVPVPKARKFDGGNADDASNSVWFDLNRDGRAAASDDDFEDDIEMSSVKPVTGDQAEDNGGKGSEEDTLPDQKSWWHTFKYRPILGIVPVGGGEDQPLEVVLVERPSWDLDLPPRFVGTHE
jgi:U3 small nucleolar RNA-associated protein 4